MTVSTQSSVLTVAMPRETCQKTRGTDAQHIFFQSQPSLAASATRSGGIMAAPQWSHASVLCPRRVRTPHAELSAARTDPSLAAAVALCLLTPQSCASDRRMSHSLDGRSENNTKRWSCFSRFEQFMCLPLDMPVTHQLPLLQGHAFVFFSANTVVPSSLVGH